MGNPASLSQISRYSQRALLLVTSRLQLPASAHFSIPTQPSPSVHTVLFHTTSLHHGNCSNSCIAQAPSTRKTPHCVISDPLRFSHQEKVRNASEFLREMFSMIKKREQEQVGEVRQGSALTPSKKERKGKKVISRKSLTPRCSTEKVLSEQIRRLRATISIGGVLP